MPSSACRQRPHRQRRRTGGGHVDDKQILHVGSPQFAPRKALSEIRGGLHLFRGDSPAQRHRSHVTETRLLLRMNANVVAVDVVGWMFLDRGIELESEALMQFAQKTVGSPSVPQEEK